MYVRWSRPNGAAWDVVREYYLGTSIDQVFPTRTGIAEAKWQVEVVGKTFDGTPVVRYVDAQCQPLGG